MIGDLLKTEEGRKWCITTWENFDKRRCQEKEEMPVLLTKIQKIKAILDEETCKQIRSLDKKMILPFVGYAHVILSNVNKIEEKILDYIEELEKMTLPYRELFK